MSSKQILSTTRRSMMSSFLRKKGGKNTLPSSRSSRRLLMTANNNKCRHLSTPLSSWKKGITHQRNSFSTTKFFHNNNNSNNNNFRRWLLGGGFLGTGVAAAAMGETEETDFYEYRYITTQNPDDLAGFYGSEQFMELFCVMPFMGTLMMRGGHFDDEGTVHTTGFPGEMLVNMVFSDETSDGKIKWFNKRERFRSVFKGYTAWDMVCNFGFEDLGDGRVMVYHHGARFKSSLPPVSWFVRGVFGLHARWVAWATEHHVNHYAFREDEKAEEASRVDMPLFLLKNYAWSDLMAGLFGTKDITKPASFLLRNNTTNMNNEKFYKEVITTAQPMLLAPSMVDVESKELPIHQSQILEHIAKDIKTDRENSKVILTNDTATNDNEIDLHLAIKRSNTIQRDVATKKTDTPTLEEERENLGGPVAWEALRSTNNPKAYKAATVVAQHRLSQRRNDYFLNQREEELTKFRQSLSLLYLGLQPDIFDNNDFQ